MGLVGIIGQDGGAGDHLLVNGVIFGVLLPKGKVVILVLRDELMSNYVDKQNTHRALDAGQNGLYLLDCLGS